MSPLNFQLGQCPPNDENTQNEIYIYIKKKKKGKPSHNSLHLKLEAFEVSGNQLSGQLPQHLCDGGALQGLVAFSNNLSRELLKWVGNCTSCARFSVTKTTSQVSKLYVN